MSKGSLINLAKWMEYVNFLLNRIPDKDKCIVIIDDCLSLVSSMDTWIEHGLKLSPKKCQYFHK